MNLRWIFSVLFSAGCLCFFAVMACSQAPKLPDIPGFEVKLVEGFALVLHPETLKHENEFKIPPSEVLKLELRMLGKILNPKALAAVKRMPIWVEWDEATPLKSLAKGKRFTAYYNSSNQATSKLIGMHPLQARTITICSLRSLTTIHQPGAPREQCVLLHEVAHAVHDQLIGQNNQEIVAAYKQAISRRLCDPKSPAGADFSEFFAEMTCAYLDRLDYLPHNRSELKSLDPETFRVVEKFWGKTAAAEVAKSNTGALRGLIQEDLSGIRIGIWKPGEVVQGAMPPFVDRKGKLLALGFWHDEPSAVHRDLDRLHKIQDRFAEWGIDFLLVAPASPPAGFDQLLRERGVSVSACAGLRLADPRSQGNFDYAHPPKGVVLFDSQDKAIFRGPDFASETAYRKVLMNSRLDEILNDGSTAAPKPFSEKKEWKAIRALFDKGDDWSVVFRQLGSYARSRDMDLADRARRLRAVLEKPLEDALKNYEAIGGADPVKGYLALTAFAANYRGTDLAAKARALADSWKAEPRVQKEIKAQAVLESIRKYDAQVARMRSADGSLPKQAKSILTQAQTAMKQLEETYPDALATAEGRLILNRLNQNALMTNDAEPMKP